MGGYVAVNGSLMLKMMAVAMAMVMTMTMMCSISEAIWVNLPNKGMKCVSEEIQNNVVVVADYFVIDEEGLQTSTISIEVTSPYGKILYQKDKMIQGQFAFTTTESGTYVACFWVVDNGNYQFASLNLDWKIGFAAKDWNLISKKENIKGIELELTRLEAAVEAVHDNMLYLKTRESKLREVSEKNNARVAWLSIMSIGIGIVASLIQVWYLTRYFQKLKVV